MITEKLESIVKEAQFSPATACVIWLHGLGASGKDFAEVAPELGLSSYNTIRFLFPNAPFKPVTISNGLRIRAWYDIMGLSMDSQEDAPGIEAGSLQIANLIEQQHALGIPYDRIFLIGFSQGGALALYTGVKFNQRLGGVAALSSYLPIQDQVKILSLEKADYSLPIFMAHGLYDNVLSLDFGEKSRDVLKNLGFQVDWHTYLMDHHVCSQELRDLGEWLNQILNNKS